MKIPWLAMLDRKTPERLNKKLWQCGGLRPVGFRDSRRKTLCCPSWRSRAGGYGNEIGSRHRTWRQVVIADWIC